MSSTGASVVAEQPILCGPTAAGKSALAMRLAETRALTIVSADSRQVYRGFDVGTAKPTPVERARVPHRGIDVAEPTARFSAWEWAECATRWIADASAAGRPALVVGGTGFYVRALVEPLFEAPAMDAARRVRLDAHLEGMSSAELRRWAAALDPARAHLGRTQLLRAVETALLTGERLSTLHRARARTGGLAARYLVVDPGPRLAGRIAARIDTMFAAGWVEEVEALRQRVPPDAPAWNACGYDAVRAMVEGRMTPAAAREAVLIHTRQYAKRQRTWFRHQLPPDRTVRLDPDDPSAFERLTTWWRGASDA